MIWMFAVVATALSIWVSAWFLVLVAIVLMLIVHRWYFYRSRPWRLVHFPMMRAHARALGMESVRAREEARDITFRNILDIMLMDVNPRLDVSHDEFVAREFGKCVAFYDRENLDAVMRSRRIGRLDRNNSLDGLQAALSKCVNLETPEDKALFLRMIIAGIIEYQFSEQDREEYLLEVVRGRAV